LAQGIVPYTDLPHWLPKEYIALYLVCISRAFSARLKFHPLKQTMRDTIAWDRTCLPGVPRDSSLIPQTQAFLLYA
jgi:hypothetical protein